MHSSINLKLKIFLSFLGLSALILPLFLSLTNFSLIAYFYTPTSKEEVTKITPISLPSSVQGLTALSLLNQAEFKSLENRADYLVVNLDPTKVATPSRALNLTQEELATLLDEESDLISLFKTNNLVLVTTDIASVEPLAQILKKAGLNVSVYLK